MKSKKEKEKRVLQQKSSSTTIATERHRTDILLRLQMKRFDVKLIAYMSLVRT